MTASAGRYRDVASAPVPGELPREGRVLIGYLEAPPKRGAKPKPFHKPDAKTGTPVFLGGLQIRHGREADPNPSLRGKSQKVAVNIKTDPLEREHANKRISDVGYVAACTYRKVLQRSRRPASAGGAWSSGDRVDQVISHEITILDRIEHADDAVTMIRDTAPAVGMRGQRVLELALADELTLTEVARRMTGSDDRQAVIYYSRLFRDSCEALAEHWGRRDRRPPRS